MSYHQLFYHVVWATKNREPLLTEKVEPLILRYLWNKALSLDGTPFALNGFRDHIHLIATIPPQRAVSTFIGQVKGVTSARFNKEHPDLAPFYWQEEYSVFSFDKKRMADHIRYVQKQKEHHLNSSIVPALEHCPEDGRRISEEKADYFTNVDEKSLWEDILSKLL